jgi:mannosyltransferase OCH1-like enzyme
MKIPKIIHHIWIGHLPPPVEWMNTWKVNHPDWEYILWDNEKVFSRKWDNQKHIDYYFNKKVYEGAADILRYQILYEFGGIMPGADSENLNPVDELFDNDYELFAVNTGERYGLQRNHAWLKSTAPLYGCTKGHWFAKALTDEIKKKDQLKEVVVKETGNLFMRDMIEKYNPDIKIFPIHYFVPEHYEGIKYTGTDKIYCRHYWGSTVSKTDKSIGEGWDKNLQEKHIRLTKNPSNLSKFEQVRQRLLRRQIKLNKIHGTTS